MLRQWHSWPGLIAALLLMVVSLTGAVLSVYPALGWASARPATGLSVAMLAARVTARVPGVESLVREPSGLLIAYHLVGEAQQVSVIDPATGQAVADYQPSATQRWVRNLHRRLLLDDAGRVATGVGAAALLLVLLSGLLLLVRRMGGWRQLLGTVQGNSLQRLHNQTARYAMAGLLLSAATGVLMSLASFGLLPEGGGTDPLLNLQPSAATHLPLASLPALQAVDVADLRQLKLAVPGDANDVIELETSGGAGVVDPATGTWLAYRALDGWQRLHATVRWLHTGEGPWWLGLLLGASSLAVPLLAVTGFLLWRDRRQGLPRLLGNAPAQSADTVLLVGSETNTTWGFAVALHAALGRAGLRVHTAPMNGLQAAYGQAQRLIVLTATYGDGEAPESARQFLARLAAMPAAPGLQFAVLGFGDRQFPKFCAYAQQVHAALAAKGLQPLGPPGTVDQQSEPEFHRWCLWLGQALGQALGQTAATVLDVQYTPQRPPSTPLALLSRTDYGADPQTLAVVLRFAPVAGPREAPSQKQTDRPSEALPGGAAHSPSGAPLRKPSWWQRLRGAPGLPRFDTGDLLGVLPPGGAAPRFYSLASAAADGVAEICVRRQPGGLCSSYLTGLQPGDTIQAFVRPHASFRPAAGGQPVVLIGAGTGIGPLVGFIRHNPPQRPMFLYFGARRDDADFLYRDELHSLLGQRRLRQLTTAFSRAQAPAYVQDRLLADLQPLRALIDQGAQVMVCGGRQMAAGVEAAWERILAGSGLSVAQLKAQGRYVEDVY